MKDIIKTMKRILIFVTLFFSVISICKAENIWGTRFYGMGVKEITCSYDVKGINGFNKIFFYINEWGFYVAQGFNIKPAPNEYDYKITEIYYSDYTNGTDYIWEESLIPYYGDYTIKYAGSDDDIPFDAYEFAVNVSAVFSKCPNLYLGHKNGEKNYEIFQYKPSNTDMEYIEVEANHKECSIKNDIGEELYDTFGYSTDDQPDLDSSEKTKTDDTREKVDITQNYNLDYFYDNHLYGNTNFGIVKECLIDYININDSLLLSVGLSNIKFNDHTVEACLLKFEYPKILETGSQDEKDMDLLIKGQYNDHRPNVTCEAGYRPTRLKKIITTIGDNKSTFYYGEVCILMDGTTIINEMIEEMKATYNIINFYNAQCDEEKSKAEINKISKLITEYSQFKDQLTGGFDFSEGDRYYDLLQKATYICGKRYSRRSTSPMTGVLSCDAILGGENGAFGKIVSNLMKFVKYGGPILMLLLTIVDLVKTATSGEDKDFKKVFQNFIKRFIAAVLLFFITDIVRLIFLIFGLDFNCVIKD